jgi:predicted nucleic acid-binding protein
MTSDLAAEAFEIALEFDSTAYDACYVALSARLGVPLLTADERLVRKLARTRFRVLWLGDLDLPPRGEED